MEVEWTVGPIPINDDLGVRSASYVAVRLLLASTGRQSGQQCSLRVCPADYRMHATAASHWQAATTSTASPHKRTPLVAGKEVVVRYGSSLKTGRRFATDANGREMQVRSGLQHTLESPGALTVK